MAARDRLIGIRAKIERAKEHISRGVKVTSRSKLRPQKRLWKKQVEERPDGSVLRSSSLHDTQLSRKESWSGIAGDAVLALVLGKLLGIIRPVAQLAVGQGAIRFGNADAYGDGCRAVDLRIP
jgi:hypothetical protein